MTRRRLYNPAQLTPEELKASFVAREDTLAEMLRLISEQRPGHPCQHMMLIGPRGMGKTTLGLRLLHEILETPALVAAWQPVAFHEESYGVSNLADFWLTALNHLSRATEDARWADRAVSLARDERDDSRLAAYALAALMDYCQASGKRLILFVENIDIIFKQLGDERQVHELRATLIERPEILLIGSANTVFETIYSHGEPLYEFFRLFILKGLGPEDTRRILARLAKDEGRPEVIEIPDREGGRLETIRRMTGGNPRLVVLACQILIESPLGSAFEDLERLIDEQTPYFKARIEELPIQARKVFHCLAEGWRPMQAREVADAAKLSSSHASAQLKQLMEKGYAREVALPDAKRSLYEVGDRFYNIYYVLRFSRTGRDRLERLIAFLHDLFGPVGMRTMYPTALVALRTGGLYGGEPFSLLGILAGYVAEDEDFTGRDDWRRRALTLARDTLGPNAPVIAEIHESFSAYDDRASSDRLTELLSRSGELSKAGRFQEAEALCRAAVEETPNNAGAWTALAFTLLDAGRHRAAITAFDRVPGDPFPDDKSVSGVLAAAALVAKTQALYLLKRYTEAVAVVNPFEENLAPSDAAALIHLAAWVSHFRGMAFAKLDRHEEAMAAWKRVAEYVQGDGPPELRHIAAKSLCDKGATLYQLDRYDEAMVAWQRAAEYVHVDDTSELRELATTALMGSFFLLLALGRDDESLDTLEHALHIGGGEYESQQRPLLTASLCEAVATGHGEWVKRVMEEKGLTESMEPLWHAVRAELGEELEPLPAEIMDAVTDIRRKFVRNPNSP